MHDCLLSEQISLMIFGMTASKGLRKIFDPTHQRRVDTHRRRRTHGRLHKVPPPNQTASGSLQAIFKAVVYFALLHFARM
jgi:hypothetical protein